jgi:Lon protease-like protein
LRIEAVIEIPAEVPIMSLPNAVLFPHSLLPLHIFEPRYRAMLAYCLDQDRMFAVALRRPASAVAHRVKDHFPIAGVGLIRACVGNEDGTSNLVLQGLARVRLLEWTQKEPFRVARTEIVESTLNNPIEADALGAKVKEMCHEIEQMGVPMPLNLMDHLVQMDSTDVLSDVVAAAFVGERYQRQQLLEVAEVSARLRLLIQFLRAQMGQNS